MELIRHTVSAPGALLSGSSDSKLVLRFGVNGPWRVGLLIFKSMVGVSLFAMPRAFHSVGIVGGLLIMVIAATLCTYSNSIILRVKSVVARDTLKKHL